MYLTHHYKLSTHCRLLMFDNHDDVKVCCGHFKLSCLASVLLAVQALLTAPLESTHLSWRGSLLTHVLCGQLSGLDRHSADAAACSLSTCAQVSLQAHPSR